MRRWLLCIIFFPMLACAGIGIKQTSVNPVKKLSAEVNKTTVCVTDDDWPPYVFLSQSKPSTLIGASIDAIDFVFKEMGKPYRLQPIVWTRLTRAESKSFRFCDVIWDMPESTADALGLPLSLPLYNTRAAVLFDAKTFKREEIETFSFTTLFSKKAKLCGIRGSDYGVLAPFIDISVKDTQQALDLIGKSRCTLFFSGAHVVEFGAKHDVYTIPINLGFSLLPKKHNLAYYAALTKTDDASLHLLKKINTIIDDSVRHGDWQKLYQKYDVHSNLQSQAMPQQREN